MSHSTVAVLTDKHTTVEGLLAPYDENIRVEKYMAHTKAELIAMARERLEEIKNTSYAEFIADPEAYLEKKCNGNPDNSHYKYLRDEFMQRYNETDEEIYKRAIASYDDDMIDEEGNVYSTYNPKSKWDWYSYGGRWGGLLISKETGEHCDEALVSDIDFEKMEQEELEGLSSYEDAINKSFFKPEYMRRMYPTEDIYKLISTSFWTRAVLTPDGEWHELGEMGWFGMSSEEPEDVQEWAVNYYDRFMKPAIENGWHITIIDYHI